MTAIMSTSRRSLGIEQELDLDHAYTYCTVLQSELS